MKRVILLAFTITMSGFAASVPQSELAIGRAYYANGEVRKAATHFEMAVRMNPNDAEAWYRAGMSYQVLADIATPFDRKYKQRARAYLTRATELAPTHTEYRRELFNFLLDPGNSSRATLRQARGIIRTLPESDPEYASMSWQLESESRAAASAEARLGAVLLAGPRLLYGIADTPASAVRRSGARPLD